jgi:signal transduction histidine kinase/CheY-like chemotaxis protein
MNSAAILVVEDEQIVALDIEKRLSQLGYGVTTASSGEEAIEKVRQSRPDVVLMDVRLRGGIDGVEAAQRIQVMADVPIVYLTAYADESTLERARASEPYGYILKPFDERELRATIDMALKRHESDRRRKAQEELQRFLADASARLAESLDYQTVIRRAVSLMVPRCADWCFICLEPASDSHPLPPIIHTRVGSVAPSSEEERGGIIESVLRRARSEIMGATSDPMAFAKALGSKHSTTLHSLALVPRSLLCVPLVARARPLGAILLVSARSDRLYGPSDLSRAEDFAHRFSMAIDNALLYREAHVATQMMEEVLAVVSHDLRNPLGAILSRAEMLVEGSAPPGSPQSIVRNAEWMNRLITDVIDAAAIHAGRISLDRKTHSADSLVRDAVDVLRPLAVAKSITINRPAIGMWDLAMCDRDRILQVLSNLIGNAIKYTPIGGAITVRVERDGARLRFSVSDTGPGIAKEQAVHLFERFWHAQTHRNGAGLGLYIARGIVEAHGGYLGVDSRVGNGSTFFFTLPAAPRVETHALRP